MNARSESSLLGDILTTLIYSSIFPGFSYTLYLNDIILLNTFKLSLVLFFLIFFIGPLIFKLSYSIQQQVIFLNYVQWPKNPSYDAPEKYELNGTKNFFINSEDNVKLGAWHILPANSVKENASSDYFDAALRNGVPVVIYMHGNSGNRAASHRIELYKIIRKQYHVIAFDYRSYGDSTKVSPTEPGCVTDAISVIQWVRNKTNSKIFVWGHSLGTGISTHALDILSKEKIQVDGLILESPFNNIRCVVGEHPSSWLFKNLPWFQYTVVDALYNSGFRFETDVHILQIDCPILILHAEDDLIVPFKLGFRLYSVASENRTNKQGPVLLEKFEWKLNYGHKYICRAPELPQILEKFVENNNKLF